MKESKNEIYTLVDEEFISGFQENHRSFMKTIYYEFYLNVCKKLKRKPLCEIEFFSNMHRRRIQFYQLCCPYCGTIHILIHDKKIRGQGCYNYCVNCGRGSTVENIKNQIARFIRIFNINNVGLSVLKEKYPDTEEWLLGYDCYQMELIELASIIEVIFRDYFEALIYINNFGVRSEYILKVLDKHTGNDFMNIEKANTNFKKAFEIDVKKVIEKDIWNDLIDIVNLRNMFVHNNGMTDAHFKRTASFRRLESKIIGNLFKLEYKDIEKYLRSVIYAVTDISNLYLEQYYKNRNIVIANYYFDNDFSILAEVDEKK